MCSLQAPDRPRVIGFIKRIISNFFRRPRQRTVVCVAVTFNLFLWPGPGLLTQHSVALVSQALNTRVGFYSYEAFVFRRIFSPTTSRPRHETMADRAAAVAHIQINPNKFVGYEDEGTKFTATPTDFFDRTIQGVKFTFESS
ncbi:MAG: hypothetical protein WAV47_06635, partial [Blastocatellia bacterium]